MMAGRLKRQARNLPEFDTALIDAGKSNLTLVVDSRAAVGGKP